MVELLLKEECVTIEEMRKQIEEKTLILEKAEKFIADASEGILKYQRKKGRLYYYRQEKESKTQQWSTTYIKKNQMNLAIELAEKGYLITVAAVLKSQIALLQDFVQKYNEEAVEEIYRNLPDERKALVEPVAIGVKEKLEAWNREEYELNTSYPEFLIYETEQGEMVRSKSELIIANVLYQYKDDIEYKYERPLELKAKDGSNIIVHPDFTIINKHTGRICYYEHAGRMDEPKYAVDFVKKMNLYSSNGILQGDELFVTYETYSMPLDINCVKKIVERIVGDIQ